MKRNEFLKKVAILSVTFAIPTSIVGLTAKNNKKMKNNKEVLETANVAIKAGNNEGFLLHCTEDTEWTFVGDQVLKGKEAVRRYMAEVYITPPKFTTEIMITGDNYVTALGKISLEDKNGKLVNYSFCDVWKFRDGKMAELKAFVVEEK